MTPAESRKPIIWMLLFGGLVLLAAVFIFDLPGAFIERSGPDSDSDFPDEYGLTLRESVEGDRNGETAPTVEQDETDPAAAEAADVEKLGHSFLSASVRGTVETVSGDPIAGAVVRLESCLPELFREIIPGGRYEAVAQSDPDGAFRITVPGEGAFRMTAEKEGFAGFFADLVLPGDDLTVVLSTGAVLSGEVRDLDTGEPVAGALVRARRGFDVRESETLGGGTFSIGDLSEGLHSVEVFHSEYDVTRMDGVEVVLAADNRVAIEMRPGAPLEGRVMALDTREPVEGAEVVYRIWAWEPGERREILSHRASTDKEGRFAFECVSRRGYRIEALAAGYSPGFPEPGARPGNPDTLMKIYLKRVGCVSGRVLGPDGRPIKGAEVRVMKPERPGAEPGVAKTDEDGEFEIDAVEGGTPFSLIAVHPRHGPGVVARLLVEVGGRLDGVEIVMTLASGIAGLVTGPDGEPVSNARVTVDGLKGYLMRYGDAVPMVLTDGDGEFEFGGLSSGDYVLAASTGDLRSGTLSLFLQEGETCETALEVSNGLALHGRVIDLEGIPLDDVLVTAVAFTPEPAAPKPAPQKAPSKKQSGKNTKRDDKRAAKEKKAAARERPRNTGLESRIKKALNARPWRMDPIEFEIMRRTGLSRFRGNSRTDEKGAFVLPALTEDDVLIVCFRRFGYVTEVLAELTPYASPVEVNMAPEIGLAGRVVDVNSGLPVKRFRVEWHPLEGDTRSTEAIVKDKRSFNGPERSFQAEDGSFLLERLEPGEVLMRASAKGYRVSEPKRFVVSSRYGAPFQVFRLEKGGVIHGRITAGNGSPVVQVPVFLEKEVKQRSGKKQPKNKTRKQNRITRRTDAGGRFIFSDLDEGTYRLIVADDDDPPARPATIKLGAGRNISRSFILRELGAVEARVRGEGGMSCRATLDLSGGPTGIKMHRTTGNLGIASFSNLLPGKYRLKIQAGGYMSRSENLSIKDGKEVKIEIELEKKK